MKITTIAFGISTVILAAGFGYATSQYLIQTKSDRGVSRLTDENLAICKDNKIADYDHAQGIMFFAKFGLEFCVKDTPGKPSMTCTEAKQNDPILIAQVDCLRNAFEADLRSGIEDPSQVHITETYLGEYLEARRALPSPTAE